MDKKPIAVKCTTEREFNAVKEYIIKMDFEPFTQTMLTAKTWNFKPQPGTHTFLIVGDGYSWRSDVNPALYEIISFYTFTMLTGFNVAPKEVIINWIGSPADVTVTVRHSHIKFEFAKTIVGHCLNRTQLTQILAALKSLEDED